MKITIDATSLSLPDFRVSGVAGAIKTHDVPRPLDLAPGLHTFGTTDNPRFDFTVTPSGQVQFDPSLANFLSVVGGNTLVVRGFTIEIDATALSLPEFSLLDSESINQLIPHPLTRDVVPVTLIPGTYRFGTTVSPNFVFTVTGSGNIDFGNDPPNPSLANFLSVERGDTETLRVIGYLVGIHSGDLGPAEYRVSDAGSLDFAEFSTHAFHCMSLLPGDYTFTCGFVFPFTVEDPGRFRFDPNLGPCVGGEGTQRLRVECKPN